jgi:toluene monooxygenase system ferredoxin subunit
MLPLDELWLGEMRACSAGARRVLLLRLETGVYAYQDRCPHLGVPLSQGTLREGVLTCAAHGFQYDAVTGSCMNPKHLRLVALPVRVDAEQIWVDPAPPDGGAE